MPRPARLYLPLGIRTAHRVVIGICSVLYLVGAAASEAMMMSAGAATSALTLLLWLVALLCHVFVLFSFTDTVIRVAYLEGTVLTERRAFGVRRCDVALAPAVRLEQKALGPRFCALDMSRARWMRLRFRPSTYRGTAFPHPLVALADAVLAGPPRPEPAAREAWFVASRLRQWAAYQTGRPA